MLAAIRRLCESGVKVLGLAAPDATAHPADERCMTERHVTIDAEVATLPPQRLEEWPGRILSFDVWAEIPRPKEVRRTAGQATGFSELRQSS